MEERDFYAEIRDILEDWVESGTGIDDIEEQIDTLVATIGED